MHFFSFPSILISVVLFVLCANAFPSPSESELALVSPSTNETTPIPPPVQESVVECYDRDPYAHRARVSEDACVAAMLKIMRLPGIRDSRYFTWNKYKDDRGVFHQAMWSSRGCYVYVRADFHRAVDQFSLLDVVASARSITDECVQRVAVPMGGQKEIGRAGNSFYVGVSGTVPVGVDSTTDGNSTDHGIEVDPSAAAGTVPGDEASSNSTEMQAGTGNAIPEVGLPDVVCWDGQPALKQIDTSDCDFVIQSRIPRIAPEMELERWGYTTNTDIRLPAYWGYHQCYVTVSNPNTAVVDIFTTLELELTARRIVNRCTGPGTKGLGGYCAIGNGKGFYATVQNPPPPRPGDSITGTGPTTGATHYDNVNDPSLTSAGISLTSRDKGFTVMFSDSTLLRKRAFRFKSSTPGPDPTGNLTSSSTSTYSDSPDVRCIPPSATSATPTPAKEVDPRDCQKLVENLYADLLNQTRSIYKGNTTSASTDADDPENYYPIIPQTSRYQSCFAVINSTAGNGNTYTPPTLPSGNSSGSSTSGVGGAQPRPVPLAVPQQPSPPSVDAATFFTGAFQIVQQCLLRENTQPPLGGVALLAPYSSNTTTDSAGGSGSGSTQEEVQIYLAFSAYDSATNGSAEPEVLQETLTNLIASTGGNNNGGLDAVTSPSLPGGGGR